MSGDPTVRSGRRWRVLLGSTLLSAAMVGASGIHAPGAEQVRGPDRVVEGAKAIGRGVEETAKGVGQTVTEGARRVGKEMGPVADTLHDRAKQFGEAIWDGMKSLGRTLEGVFTGRKKR